jgi:diguanylate cyclase (GGDEF)-like protein
MKHFARRIASCLGLVSADQGTKMRWMPILAWPLAACLIAAAGWIFLDAQLNQKRLATEEAATDTAQILARGYAGQLARTLESVDQTLIHVRFEWEMSHGTLALDKVDRAKFFFPSTTAHVFIIDREGQTVASTLPDRFFLADRLYFRYQKESGRDSLFIGPPLLGRGHGDNVVPFSRPLFDANGNFDGIVMVAMYAGYFTESYDPITLGHNGLLAVAGTQDNVLRAARIGDTVFLPRAQVLLKTPLITSENGATLLNGKEWFHDRRSRYLGWQKVAGYPLIAYSGLDEKDALAPYRAAHDTAIRNVLWAAGALFAFAALAAALSFRLQRSQQELGKVQAAYRLATEEGMEGFFILRALAAGEADTDFEITDCNMQGAALFGRSPAALIGARLSSLYPRSHYRRLLQRLLIAMRTGFYECDLPAFFRESRQVRWMHLKIVMSREHLALTVHDVSQEKAHLKELERKGNEDALTMLPNRYWVLSYLPQAISQVLTNHSMLAVLFVDLDGFKKINDAIGHAAGDELLRHAAARLKHAVRPHDHVARIGGDEFVVIIENVDRADEIEQVAKRILAAFEEGFHYSEKIHTIGASIGISLCPTHGRQAETLLKSADIAMYAVKTTGKGSYRFFEDRLIEMLQQRLETEMQLRQALREDNLVVYYQPRVALATGRISSLEALVRWQHPQRGLISPNEFIPLAEETGLILPLGEAVIEKVFAQLEKWSKPGIPLAPVSINVSPRQLSEVDIPQVFSSAFGRHKIVPAWIEVEITESSMVGEGEKALETIKALQSMGIKVLIDDFGTGYSSLSQLQQLNFDVLKIDRSFTEKGETSEQGKVFLDAIITMAHALGMAVVAEGVENRAQLEVLKRLRCDEVQGFLFAGPLAPGERQPSIPTEVLAAI